MLIYEFSQSVFDIRINKESNCGMVINMWDMEEEHKELYSEEQIRFIEMVTSQFEHLINILYQLRNFKQICFAVDVFMIKNEKAEQKMKEIIYKYYKLFCAKENIEDGREFLNSPLFGEQIEIDSLESGIKYMLGIDDNKIHDMPVELEREFIDALKESARNLNTIFHGEIPVLYTIPKECECFQSRVMSDVYLGIIFSGHYLVYDDYCILIISGSTE